MKKSTSKKPNTDYYNLDELIADEMKAHLEYKVYIPLNAHFKEISNQELEHHAFLTSLNQTSINVDSQVSQISELTPERLDELIRDELKASKEYADMAKENNGFLKLATQEKEHYDFLCSIKKTLFTIADTTNYGTLSVSFGDKQQIVNLSKMTEPYLFISKDGVKKGEKKAKTEEKKSAKTKKEEDEEEERYWTNYMNLPKDSASEQSDYFDLENYKGSYFSAKSIWDLFNQIISKSDKLYPFEARYLTNWFFDSYHWLELNPHNTNLDLWRTELIKRLNIKGDFKSELSEILYINRRIIAEIFESEGLSININEALSVKNLGFHSYLYLDIGILLSIMDNMAKKNAFRKTQNLRPLDPIDLKELTGFLDAYNIQYDAEKLNQAQEPNQAQEAKEEDEESEDPITSDKYGFCVVGTIHEKLCIGDEIELTDDAKENYNNKKYNGKWIITDFTNDPKANGYDSSLSPQYLISCMGLNISIYEYEFDIVKHFSKKIKKTTKKAKDGLFHKTSKLLKGGLKRGELKRISQLKGSKLTMIKRDS